MIRCCMKTWLLTLFQMSRLFCLTQVLLFTVALQTSLATGPYFHFMVWGQTWGASLVIQSLFMVRELSVCHSMTLFATYSSMFVMSTYQLCRFQDYFHKASLLCFHLTHFNWQHQTVLKLIYLEKDQCSTYSRKYLTSTKLCLILFAMVWSNNFMWLLLWLTLRTIGIIHLLHQLRKLKLQSRKPSFIMLIDGHWTWRKTLWLESIRGQGKLCLCHLELRTCQLNLINLLNNELLSWSIKMVKRLLWVTCGVLLMIQLRCSKQTWLGQAKLCSSYLQSKMDVGSLRKLAWGLLLTLNRKYWNNHCQPLHQLANLRMLKLQLHLLRTCCLVLRSSRLMWLNFGMNLIQSLKLCALPTTGSTCQLAGLGFTTNHWSTCLFLVPLILRLTLIDLAGHVWLWCLTRKVRQLGMRTLGKRMR